MAIFRVFYSSCPIQAIRDGHLPVSPGRAGIAPVELPDAKKRTGPEQD